MTSAILANLRHAVRNNETVTIGGGNFGPGELLAVALTLESQADLLTALRLALPHVEACAEKDDYLAMLALQEGASGSAAMARKSAEMRRAAARVIQKAIAQATGDKQ